MRGASQRSNVVLRETVVVFAGLTLLLLGVVLTSRGGGRMQGMPNEAFFVGAAKCDHVPVAASPKDPISQTREMCKRACAAHPGYLTASAGPVPGGVGGGSVLCRCCDPASQVDLAVEFADSSATCLPNVTYGISQTDNRSMYVRGGCGGMFKWSDGSLVECRSEGNGVGKTVCPYYDDKIKLTEMARVRRAKESLLGQAAAEAARAKELARLRAMGSKAANVMTTLAYSNPAPGIPSRPQ